jgi:predicted DNA-binding transcriptional regulator AlpA
MLKTAAGEIIGNVPRRFLRLRAVRDLTGLTTSTLYDLME